MKTCRKCREKKPDYEFPRKANGKHGVRTTCKQCIEEKKLKHQLKLNQPKVCTKCHILKPVSDFPKKAGGMPGFRSVCKQCKAEYVRKARAKKRKTQGPSKKRATEKVTESVIIPVSFYLYKKIKAHTKRTDQSIAHFVRTSTKDFIRENKDKLKQEKRKIVVIRVTPEFLKELNESKRPFTSRSELIKTALIERLAFECEVVTP